MSFLSFSQSATFGLLGLVDVRGTTMGVIGACGNIGAIIVAIVFRQLSYKNAFEIVGVATMFSALLSFFLDFPDRPGFQFCSQNSKNETSSQQTDDTELDLESLEKSDKSSVSSNKLYSPEIGIKMMEGWTLVLDSHCTSCAIPKLSSPNTSEPICVLCNQLVTGNKSDAVHQSHIGEKIPKHQFDEIPLYNPYTIHGEDKPHEKNHFDSLIRISSSQSDIGPQNDERLATDGIRRMRSFFSLKATRLIPTDDFDDAIQRENDR